MIEGLNEDWNSDIKLEQTAAQRKLQLAITQSVRYERSLLHSLYLTILSVRISQHCSFQFRKLVNCLREPSNWTYP